MHPVLTDHPGPRAMEIQSPWMAVLLLQELEPVDLLLQVRESSEVHLDLGILLVKVKEGEFPLIRYPARYQSAGLE